MSEIINVIIPVYNSERTIAQTLASLMTQNYPRKFIVSVVDDKSTDDTMNIVEDFKKYLPLRILHQEINRGVGPARQLALSQNECDIVCFLDSDDKFFPYTINMFLREMNQMSNKEDDFPEVLYSDFISEFSKEERLISGRTGITWFHGKAYRKSFLDKYDITIPLLRYNEDSGFSTMVHELAQNKIYVPEISYFWSENPNSITRSDGEFNVKSLPHFIESISLAFDHIAKYKDLYALPIFYFQLNNFYNYYMDSIYLEREWAGDIHNAIQIFFDKYWVEDRIRPELVIKGFTMKPPGVYNYLVEMTPVQWINLFSKQSYTIQDFRI